MARSIPTVFAATAVALACATTCQAQTASPANDIGAAAQQVAVTATRSPRALAELPVSAVVSSSDIEDTPGFALDDVLRRVAGVSVNDPIFGDVQWARLPPASPGPYDPPQYGTPLKAMLRLRFE